MSKLFDLLKNTKGYEGLILNPSSKFEKSWFEGSAGQYTGSMSIDEQNTFLQKGIDWNPSNLGYSQDQRALAQTAAEKWGRATLQMGTLAASTFFDSTIGTAFAIGESLINWDANKIVDNSFSTLMSKWQKSVEKNNPLYYTREERDTPWYQRLGTANFWADTIYKNMGFTIGAGLSMVATSGAAYAGLTKAFSKRLAGQLGKALAKNGGKVTDDLVKKYAEYGVKNGDDLFKLGQQQPKIAADILKELETTSKTLSGINLASQGAGLVGSAVGEGRIEAIHGKEEFYNELISQGYTAEDAERLSTQKANVQFGMNVGLLSISNFVQFKTLLKPLTKGTSIDKILGPNSVVGGLKNQAKDKLGLGLIKGSTKTGYELAENNLKRKTVTALRVLGNPLMEFNEEMQQGVIDNYSSEILLRANDGEGLSFTNDIIGQYLQSAVDTYTDFDHAWEEGIAGLFTGMVGSPNVSKVFGASGPLWAGGVMETVSEIKQEKAQAKEQVTALNKIIESSSFKNLYKGAVIHSSYENDIERNEANQEDVSLAVNTTAQLVNDIITFAEAGKLDDFKETIAVFENSTGAEIRESLLINPKALDAKAESSELIDPNKNKTDAQLEKEAKERARYVSNKIDQISELKTQLENKLGYLKNADTISRELITNAIVVEELNKKAIDITNDLIKNTLAPIYRDVFNSEYQGETNREINNSALKLKVNDAYVSIMPQDIVDVLVDNIDTNTAELTDEQYKNNVEENVKQKVADLFLMEKKDLEKLLKKEDTKDLDNSEKAAIKAYRAMSKAIEAIEKSKEGKKELNNLLTIRNVNVDLMLEYQEISKDLEAHDKKIDQQQKNINNAKEAMEKNPEASSLDEAGVLNWFKERRQKVENNTSLAKAAKLLLLKNIYEKAIELLNNLNTATSKANAKKLSEELKRIKEELSKLRKEEKDNKNKFYIGNSKLAEIYDKYLTEEQKAAAQKAIHAFLYELTDSERSNVVSIKLGEEVELTDSEWEHPKFKIKAGNRLGRRVEVYIDFSKILGDNPAKAQGQVLIGGLLDPNRFEHKKGGTLDLTDKNLLALIQNEKNPLVDPETFEFTPEGEAFVANYLALNDIWETSKKELEKTGDVSRVEKYLTKVLNLQHSGFSTIYDKSEQPLLRDKYEPTTHGIDLGFGQTIYVTNKSETVVYAWREGSDTPQKLDKKADAEELNKLSIFLSTTSIKGNKVKTRKSSLIGSMTNKSDSNQLRGVIKLGNSYHIPFLQVPYVAKTEEETVEAIYNGILEKITDLFSRKGDELVSLSDTEVTVNGAPVGVVVSGKDERLSFVKIRLAVDNKNWKDNVASKRLANIQFRASYKEKNSSTYQNKTATNVFVNGKSSKLMAVNTPSGVKIMYVANELLGEKVNGKVTSFDEEVQYNNILNELSKESSSLIIDLGDINNLEDYNTVFKQHLKVLQSLIAGNKENPGYEVELTDFERVTEETYEVDKMSISSDLRNELQIKPTSTQYKKGKKKHSELQKQAAKPAAKPQPEVKSEPPVKKGDDGPVASIQKILDTVMANLDADNNENVIKGLELLSSFTEFLDRTGFIVNNTQSSETLDEIINTVGELVDFKRTKPAEASEEESKKDEDKQSDTTSEEIEVADDDEPPFTTEGFGEFETREEAAQRLSEILGIPVRRLENVLKGGNALGMFFNSVIYLKDKINSSVKYHEAFHAVFRMYLSEEEQAYYYKEAAKKFGKPTAQQLKDLKDIISGELGRPAKISNKELSLLWLEEQMSDDFAKEAIKKDVKKQKLAEAKGLKRLYLLFLDLIDKVMSSGLSTLYNDIYNGDFKNAQPKANSVIRKNPAFKVYGSNVKRKGTDGVVRPDYIFLNNRMSNIVVSGIAQMLYESAKTNSTNKLSVKSFDEAYDKMVKKLDPSSYDTNDVTNKVAYIESKGKFKDYQFLLSLDTIKEEIRKDVSMKLKLYDTQIEDDIDEDDGDFVRFQKSIWETGGFGTLSKRMKTYLGFTQAYADIYGLGLPEKDIYKFSIDPFQTYQYLERNLVGTPKPQLLDKFRILATADNVSKDVYNNLVKDIADELNMTVALVEDLIEARNISELENSPLFNDFISTFYKIKGNMYMVEMDPKTRTTSMYHSNSKGVDDTQVQEWSNEHTNILEGQSDRKEYVLSKVLEIKQILEKPVNTSKELSKKALDIKKVYKDLGINLELNYIKWSLLNRDGSKLIKEDAFLNNFYNTYKGSIESIFAVEGKESVTPFHDLINTVASSGNTINSVAGLFTKSEKDQNVKDVNIIGMSKRVARYNAVFNPHLTESTFLNAEGKQIYDKIYPSYIYEQLMKLNKILSEEDNYVQLLELLDNNDLEGIQTFYTDTMDSYMDMYEIQMLSEMLRYNPMFSSEQYRENPEFAKYVFSKLDFAVHDGLVQRDTKALFKRKDSANSFKRLDDTAAELFSMALFSDTESKTIEYKNPTTGEVIKQKLRWVHLGQNEGKSTVLSVLMPADIYITESKKSPIFLNETGAQEMFSLLSHEIASIKRVRKEVEILNGDDEVKKSKIKYSPDYHGKIDETTGLIDINTARGNKFFNFPAEFEDLLSKDTFDLDTKLDNENTVKEQLDQYLSQEYSQYEKDLIDSGLMNSEYKSDTIPMSYIGNGQVNLSKLREYFVTDFLNSFKFNLYIHGNYAAKFKNHENVIKRNAELIANGPSMHVGNVKYAIVESQEELISAFEAIRHGVDKELIDSDKQKPVDSTDAQSIGTVSFLKKYLRALGKVTNTVEKVLTKIDKGLDLVTPLSSQELKTLETNNATLQPKKIVQGDMFSYIKTSLHTLTISQVAKLKQTDITEEELLEAWKNKKYDVIFNNIFEPLPGKEVLYDLLQKQYRQELDFITFDSAVKTFKSNINKVDNGRVDLSLVQELSSSTIREQVNTDGFKVEVVDSSQKSQLIWTEQDQMMTAYFMDQETNPTELQKAFLQIQQERIKQGLEEIKIPSLFNIDIDGNLVSPNWEQLMSSMRASMEQSTEDPLIAILFQGLQGETPKYSMDPPVIQKKYQAMYLSFLSKKVLAHKKAGNKYTLVSDFGIKVQHNSKVITEEEFNKLSEKDKSKVIFVNGEYHLVTKTLGNKTRGNVEHRLRHRVWDDTLNAYVSEVIVSEKVLNKFGLKKGDVIRPEILLQLGVRIPTQDKHSMVVMKIVDTVPSYMGNMIHLPFEVVKLSGADFDIDSLFATAFEWYVNDLQEQVIYGDYLKEKTIDKALEKAHSEYLQYLHEKNVKDNDRYKELFESIRNNLANEYKKELEYLSVSKTFKALMEGNETMFDTLSEFFLQNAEKAQSIGFRKLLKLNERAKELALQQNELYISPAQFSKKYKGQVRDNLKNYKGKNFSEIKGLNQKETNNLLHRLETQLASNEGNKKIAATPASMTIIKDLRTRLENEGKVSVESGKNSFSRNFKRRSRRNILVGAENIGPAALFNILFQKLRQANFSGGSYFKGNGFRSDTVLSLETKKEVRINDVISALLSNMTDNANEQDAAVFNLTPSILNIVLSEIGQGVSPEIMLTAAAQEMVAELNNIKSILDSNIKTKKAEEYSKILKDSINKKEAMRTIIINSFLSKKGFSKNEIAAFETKGFDPEVIQNTNEFYEKLISILNVEEGSISKEEMLENYSIQLAVVDAFLNAEDFSTDFVTPMAQLSSLIKGFKSSFEEIQLEEPLKALGLEVVKKDPEKNTNDINNFVIKEIKESEESGPSEILNLFTNTLLGQEVKAAAALLENSDSFFISKSRFFKSIVNTVTQGFKENYMRFADNAFKVNEAVISRLMGSHLNLNPEVLFDKSIKVTIDKLREEYPNNKFLKYLLVKPIKFETSNRTMYDVEIDSWTSSNPSFVAELMAELSIIGRNKKGDKDIDSLFPKLISYLMVKNGLTFQNGSYVRYIDPYFLTKTNDRLIKLKDYLSTLNPYGVGKAEIETLLGMPMQQFEYETSLMFSLMKSNEFNLNFIDNATAFKIIKEATDRIEELSTDISEDNKKNSRVFFKDIDSGVVEFHSVTNMKNIEDEDKKEYKNLISTILKSHGIKFNFGAHTITNPTVLKINGGKGAGTYRISKTISFHPTLKGHFVVRDFINNTQLTYKGYFTNNIDESIENAKLVEDSTKDVLDFELDSVSSQYVRTRQFGYNEKVLPYMWSIDNVLKYSEPAVTEETSTTEGGSASGTDYASLADQFLKENEVKKSEEKPAQQDSEVETSSTPATKIDRNSPEARNLFSKLSGKYSKVLVENNIFESTNNPMQKQRKLMDWADSLGLSPREVEEEITKCFK